MRVQSVLGFPLVGILVFSGVMAAPVAPSVLDNETAILTPSLATRVPTNATPVERGLIVFETITVTCKHKKCPNKEMKYDVESLPKEIPQRTCAREALAAVAKWREFCRLDTFLNQYCWVPEPSLRKCCGKTVKVDDPVFVNYPTARYRRQINTAAAAADQTFAYRLEYPEIRDIFNESRMIIMHEEEKYNMGDKEDKSCHRFQSQSLKEFNFWMGKLNYYGVEDADENGKVFGMEKWNPEGMWHNLQSWRGGEELLKYEEAIVKSGWKG